MPPPFDVDALLGGEAPYVLDLAFGFGPQQDLGAVTGTVTFDPTQTLAGHVAGVGTMTFTLTAGSITGAIITAGLRERQRLLLVNEHATNSATFATAGTSNVLGGTAVVIPPATAVFFLWNTHNSRWVPVFSAASATFAGAVVPGGGVQVVSGTGPTVFHSGAAAAITTTQGTDTTPVVTETYIAEVFIPVNASITGVSILNGSAVAGSIVVALYDNTGAVVANSALAGTAASGTAAFQQVPFTAPYAAKGPAKYFIGLQHNNTSNRYRSHILGNFGAAKKTGEVFGTLTTITPPTTFTTNLGPIADTY